MFKYFPFVESKQKFNSLSLSLAVSFVGILLGVVIVFVVYCDNANLVASCRCGYCGCLLHNFLTPSLESASALNVMW